MPPTVHQPPTPAGDGPDVHPREDAVKVISAALAACGCSRPVDPYDPEDVGSVAAEAVWALIHAGLLPVVGSTAVTS